MISFILVGCIDKKNDKKVNFEYLKFSKNILNYQVTPTNKFDKSGLMFSDQGAWFAYSFPDSIGKTTGFSGPFLMTQQNGIWSSASLSNLIIENNSWLSHTSASFNSHLEQTFLSENLELKQELVFSSGHTAIIKSTLKNISTSDKQVKYHFKNETLLVFVQQDMGVVHTWVEEKVSYDQIEIQKAVFKEQFTAKEHIDSGNFFTSNQNKASKVKQWRYISEDKKQCLRILEHEEKDWSAFLGQKVDPVEFTNITPAADTI